MRGIREGERLQHKRTGAVVTVTAYNPHCGNVYVGEMQREISPVLYRRVPREAGTLQPYEGPNQPVATNGHSKTEAAADFGIPALRRAKEAFREKLPV